MDKNLTVSCTLCAGGRPRELLTAKNSTSNLNRYLERVHSNLWLVANQSFASVPVEDDGTSESKQQKLDFSRPVVKMLEEEEVRRLVAEYVVEDALPLSIVEAPARSTVASEFLEEVRGKKKLIGPTVTRWNSFYDNATKPSSAPVEKLFGVGGLDLSTKQNCLGDEPFQRLLSCCAITNTLVTLD
ncbi:unnamed protein product [Lepeophtheirus salmonis]|uniref:(salmon louse) hypothetical protein n=1 Tax=Lepeophtheirus salmonis TaxID=72036 RepID=A0A7R8D1F7_LEPSM|nr:unnamed protein product [Lepeophtheirus salmonis]CAF2989229.1 unnamed protein product [Lepeophtheirus salmonis]